MNPDPKFLDEYALGWAADRFLEQPCAETELALLGELYAQGVLTTGERDAAWINYDLLPQFPYAVFLQVNRAMLEVRPHTGKLFLHFGTHERALQQAATR